LAVAAVGVLASPKEEPKTATPSRDARRTELPKPEPVEAARTDRLGDPLLDGVLARMDSRRLRHGGVVRDLSFSPDGKTLVSGGGGRLRLWDTATGKLQQRLDFALERTLTLAFSADEMRVASVDEANIKKGTVTVQFINPADGKVRRRVEMDIKAASGSLAFTPNGRRLALAVKNFYRLYDPTTGQETLRIPRQTLGTPVFSPDAKSFAIGDRTDTVKLYSATDGKIIRELKREGDRILSVAFSPDGCLLATLPADDTGNGETSIWDLTTGKERQRLKGSDLSAFCAAFSPDSKYLALGCTRGDLVLWEVATGKEVRRFPTDAYFEHVTFSPDGKAVAASSGWGTIRLWEVATGRVLPASADPLMDTFRSMRFSASGKQLVGTAEKLNVWWDPATGREIRRLPAMPDSSGSLQLSPDESLVAGQSKTGTIQLWDAQTRQEVRTLKGHEGWVWSTLFSSDGRRLTSGSYDGTIRVWDVATGRELHKLMGLPKEQTRMAASPDGHWLASTCNAKGPQGSYEVILWDLTTAQEKRRFTLTRGRSAWPLAFSPDSRLLAVGCNANKADEHGEVKVWDVASGKERQGFEGDSQCVLNVSFSPDGRMLAAGECDGTLVLWELASGRRRHQFIGHESGIDSIAFSADGWQLAAASAEAPVYVWDIAGTLQPRRLKLSATELECFWADLKGEDAEAAFRAVRVLSAAPDQALPFLRDRLKPVRAADPKRLAQLLKALDSAELAERKQAATELEKLADADASTLRRTAHDTSSAEVRRALQDILDRLEAGTPKQLRPVRTVEALEWMATPDATKLLGALAAGAADARLTREAKSAVQRLKAKQE
jgi:WD40 repeat protein